jgi:hypothetical protein
MLLHEIVENQRKLALPNPSTGGPLDRQFRAELACARAFPDGEPHHVLNGIVQAGAGDLKLEETMQALNKLVGQLRQSGMPNRGIRNLRQSLVATRIIVPFEVAIRNHLPRANFPYPTQRCRKS